MNVEIAALVCRSTCKDIFVCDEESHFYSQCLVKLVLKDCDKREEVLSNPTHVAVFGVNTVHVITRANLVLCAAGCATQHLYKLRHSCPASCLKMEFVQIIEFGTGDGSPVIHALETWGQYTGVIHGFEISPSAATAARHSAAAHGVSNQYKVQLCAHLFGCAMLLVPWCPNHLRKAASRRSNG